MAVGDGIVCPRGPGKESAVPDAAAPSLLEPAALGAAAKAVVAALQAPKRKRGKATSMARVDTMEAFALDCDCHNTKQATTSTDSRPDGSPVPVICTFYECAQRQQLYSWQQAPAALRFNKYIRSGYRAGYTYPECCRSMLGWHNETGNIWTHLVPGLLILALLVGGQLEAWQGARVAYAMNVASILLCFVGSVCYHTFMANHHTHDTWLKLDICGVLLVLVGGGHMVLWWGHYCHPSARLAYAFLYYGCGAVCVYKALTASSAVARGVPLLVLLLIRFSSFVTRALLGSPGNALQHYVAMEVCSLLGGLLNVLRIPERWLQPSDASKGAPLDYLFNSHQIMHVLVACAMWQLHLGAAADYATVSALLEGSEQCPAVYS